jgi:hypothetical protein
LNSGPSPWATLPVLFCERFFQDRVSQTTCPAWLRTLIILISASWVDRIIGMRHQHPAKFYCVIYITLDGYVGSAINSSNPEIL